MANYDGKVVISTELDNSGIEQDAKEAKSALTDIESGARQMDAAVDAACDSITDDLRKVGREATAAAKDISAAVQNIKPPSVDASAAAKVKAILDDTTKSAKSQAASIASIYKKQGLSQSEAMRKAWSEIERTSKTASKKVGNDIEKNIGGATQRITGKLGGLKATLGKLGGAITAAFSVAAITRFAAECIELGSALQEVQNVVDVSFGDMSDRMEEFSKNAITQFGMSELAAKRTGSTYMAMAKGLGVAQDAAADMSLELTGLSGDVASFFNLDQETAAKKLQGIFTGETEALKELGVVMTQTNLKQFALVHGMNANIEAMSQAEQVALRYAFVTDALSLASGDFVRTQNSWANQTRILSMLWQQFMSEVGSTLTTVLLPAVKVLNTIVSALTGVAKAIRLVVNALFGTNFAASEQNKAVAESASAGAEAENDLAAATTAAGKAAKKSLASFDELNKLQSQSGGNGPTAGSVATGGSYSIDTTVGGTVQDNLSPQIQAIVDKVRRIIEPLKNINFSPLLDAFSRLKKALEPITSTLFDGLEWAYYNILVPFSKWTIEDAMPAFLDVLRGALELLNSTIETLKPLGKWLWDKFLQPIAQWTGTAIISALHGLSNALSGISDWISGNQEIVEAFAIVVGSFAAAWALVNGAITIWNAVGPIATTVTTAFSTAIGFLHTTTGLVFLAITALISIVVLLAKNWDTVKDVAIKAWAGIQNIWNTVASWFDKNIIQPVSRFFSNMWTGLVETAKVALNGIKQAFVSVWNGLVSVVKTPINLIIGFINSLVDGVCSGINYIISGLNNLSIDIPDWVPIFGGQTWGFNIPQIKAPQIPYLAKGAVIPPNAPFAAILGDQRSGTNIEAPLSTIQEAVALVMEEYAASNLAGQEAMIAILRDILQAVLGIEIGDRVIGEAAQRFNAKMAVVRGI